MLLSSIKRVLEHARSLYRNWRSAGSGRIAASVNLVCLCLLWLMAPLEAEPFVSLRRDKAFLYPQVDFRAPKLLDPVRIIIQTIFLMAVLPPRGHGPRLVRTVVDILRAGGALIGRVGDAFGAVALKCVRAVADDREDKKTGDRRLPSWAPGLLLVPGLALAALCITQPFNLHGQIVFLALMFVSMIVLMRIRARITLMLLFVISFVVSGRYLWWRCTSTLSTGSGIDLFFGILLLLAEI